MRYPKEAPMNAKRSPLHWWKEASLREKERPKGG